MGKLKDYLFANREKDELDSTTVVVNRSEIEDGNMEKKESTASDEIPASKTNIVTPTAYYQVEDIANDLLNGKDVIVDLTKAPIDEAKRICDFLNGVIFVLNGSVKKVARLVYLFTTKK